MRTQVSIENNQGLVEAFEGDTAVGKLEFDIIEGDMHIMHTYTFTGHEGKGVGKTLVKAAIAYAEGQHMGVTPVCSFAQALMKRF